MIDRTRRPRDLEIDFAALEKRKQHEYDKLERMIQYAQSTPVPAVVHPGYFGDAQAGEVHCGRCDNCGPATAIALRRGPTAAPIDTPAGREVLLKVLSGVARAKGRFGKTPWPRCSPARTPRRWPAGSLTQLSTYGILRDCGFTQKEVTEIIDALARAGLVETQDVDRFKPVVILTEAGWSRLKDRDGAELTLELPDGLLRRIRGGGDHAAGPRAGPGAGRLGPCPPVRAGRTAARAAESQSEPGR